VHGCFSPARKPAFHDAYCHLNGMQCFSSTRWGSNVAAGKFQLHDFVIMPDHLHLPMTLPGDISIEKTMQLIQGGFSYRLKREFGHQREVWQRGFSEVRISYGQSFLQHREYIVQNPVKAGLVDTAGKYPNCYTYLGKSVRS
jgi:putative transposase